MEKDDQLADIISLDWSNNVFHDLEGFDVQVGLNGQTIRILLSQKAPFLPSIIYNEPELPDPAA